VSLRAKLGRAVLALWVVGGVVLGAALLAFHVPGLPTPAPADPRLVALVAAGPPSWRLIHVLYADCACSSRVLDHLLARGRVSDYDEHIILIGHGPRDLARARAAGWSVENPSEAEATQRYGLESAPVLVVADDRRVIRYVGGYTDRKQSLAIHDLDLAASLRRDDPLPILPVIGCAVSARLKGWVDPLGIKSIPRS
jgi:hypothetical protein